MAYKIVSVLCVHAQMVFKLLACPVEEKKKKKFCLLLWKHAKILKTVPKAASDFCFGYPSLSLVSFFSRVLSWGAFGTIFRITMAFWTTVKVTDRNQKSRKSYLKAVTGRIFIITVASTLIKVSRNIFLDFLHKKSAINCENHQRSFKKYCFHF